MTYASSQDRVSWIARKLDEFAGLLKSSAVPENLLPGAAGSLLTRLLTFALFTKHRGFREEQEWRFVQMRMMDRGNVLDGMRDYAMGRRGLEPKLKFKLAPIEGITSADLSLEQLVHQIILGPSVADALTIKSVERMLGKLGKDVLIERLRASTTPFRPLGTW